MDNSSVKLEYQSSLIKELKEKIFKQDELIKTYIESFEELKKDLKLLKEGLGLTKENIEEGSDHITNILYTN